MPLKLTAQEDHRKMMEQLGIKELRRGAEGMNRQAPNYQNTDESKANPYPNLPDPLTTKDGQKVTSPDLWWAKRRPEIVEDFDREVYGRLPANVPGVKWEVKETKEEKVGDVPAVVKQLVGRVDNAACPAITVDIQMTVTTPAGASQPVPVILEFGFLGFGGPPRQRSPQPAANPPAGAPGNQQAAPPARKPFGPSGRQLALAKAGASR